MDPNLLAALQSGYKPVDLGYGRPPVKKKGKGGFGTSLISEGGALGGAVAGAAAGSVVPVVGTAIGGILGAGIGAFGGRLAENKVRDDRWGVGDAAKEGALSAVLSGPLRLGKYASTASKTLKGGATLSEALVDAAGAASAKKVAGAGITGSVGNKLLAGSDNLATRALKINDSAWATKFAKRTGEEVGQFATRFNIVGKSADDINNTIYRPAMKVYSEGIKAIGAVPKENVLSTIRKEVEPLLKSAFPEDKAFANSVLKQSNDILKKFGNTISATELNKLKTAAYNKVDVQLVDKAGKQSNNTYEALSNAFRKAVNEAADAKGITIDTQVLKQAGLPFKSTSLGDLGQELFGLNELTKKIDVKSRVGKGANPFGLTKAAGAIGGTQVGGLPGAAVGFGAATAMNNPKVIGGAAKLFEGAGNRLIQGGGGFNPISSAIKGQAGGGLAEALMSAQGAGDQSLEAAATRNMNPNTTNMPTNVNMMDTQYQMGDEMSSAEASPYTRENLLIDVQRDPANASKYIDYYTQLQEVYAPAEQDSSQLELSDSAIKNVTDIQSALFDIDSLGAKIQSSGVSGPISGRLRTANPFDTEAQSLQAEVNRVRQVVGKALEGGVLRKEDEVKYAKILPTVNDTKEVAASKLRELKIKLNQDLQTYVSTQQASGKGRGQYPATLQEALTQYQ